MCVLFPVTTWALSFFPEVVNFTDTFNLKTNQNALTSGKFAAFNLHLLRIMMPVNFDVFFICVGYSKRSEEGRD
jgi:hypothetical protein